MRSSTRAATETLMRWERTAGDVDGLLAGAAHRVRTRHRIPRLVAAPIEPRGAVIAYDADDDRLTFWVSAQDPHRPLSQLAHALMRPPRACEWSCPTSAGHSAARG
jgi:aerobic carbon-monoxide dehydrogenase large subunit